MIYSFKCLKCDEVFDKSETVAEHSKHKESCPKCGGKKLQQLYGSVQVQTAKKS